MSHLVFNCTRQTLVASDLEIAETALSRFKGLIGRSARDFRQGKGLWIFPSEGIHTIGMSFPIDVAYLDNNYRVIHLYHGLRPFRIASVKLKAQGILELPAGTLENSRTQIGDLLEFLASEDEVDPARTNAARAS